MPPPKSEGVLNRLAGNPDVPSNLRVQALSKLPQPQRKILIRILRDPKASAKLRALAGLKYSEVEERRLAKKKAAQRPTTNDLGLKD